MYKTIAAIILLCIALWIIGMFGSVRAECISINELQTEANIEWKKEYVDRYGRTVSVDVTPIIPQVDKVPIQIMENQMTAAQKTQEQISQILGQMSDIPEIPAIKYMLMKAGILATDTVRMPLRMLNQTEKQRLDRLLADTEVWR